MGFEGYLYLSGVESFEHFTLVNLRPPPPYFFLTGQENIGFAVRCIENHEYRKGFSYLYQNFAGARRAMHVLVKKEVRKGISMLLRGKENKVHQKCTYENMKDFKWPDITQAVDQFVPILSTAIIAAVTTTKNERSLRG